jgi:hypothetical protein
MTSELFFLHDCLVRLFDSCDSYGASDSYERGWFLVAMALPSAGFSVRLEGKEPGNTHRRLPNDSEDSTP